MEYYARKKLYTEMCKRIYMTRLNITIPDDVTEELRKRLPAKRGALSDFITQAIVEKLEREKEK